MKKKYDECLLSHLVDPNFNAHEQWLFSIQIISFAMRLNNLMPKKRSWSALIWGVGKC